MSDIRSALKQAWDLLHPTIYYVVTMDVSQGKALRIGPCDPYPEVWLLHRDDFALVGAELSQSCRLVDFRTWHPTQEDIDRAFIAARKALREAGGCS